MCVSYLSHCCDQNHGKKQLRGERVYLGPWFEGPVCASQAFPPPHIWVTQKQKKKVCLYQSSTHLLLCASLVSSGLQTMRQCTLTQSRCVFSPQTTTSVMPSQTHSRVCLSGTLGISTQSCSQPELTITKEFRAHTQTSHNENLPPFF